MRGFALLAQLPEIREGRLLATNFFNLLISP
jgi:hypothetical protein